MSSLSGVLAQISTIFAGFIPNSQPLILPWLVPFPPTASDHYYHKQKLRQAWLIRWAVPSAHAYRELEWAAVVVLWEARNLRSLETHRRRHAPGLCPALAPPHFFFGGGGGGGCGALFGGTYPSVVRPRSGFGPEGGLDMVHLISSGMVEVAEPSGARIPPSVGSFAEPVTE
jgi:hypothetical protein